MKVEDLSDEEIKERLRTIEAVSPRFGEFGFPDMQVAKRTLQALAELAVEKRKLEEESAQRKFERRLIKAKERGKL